MAFAWPASGEIDIRELHQHIKRHTFVGTSLNFLHKDFDCHQEQIWIDYYSCVTIATYTADIAIYFKMDKKVHQNEKRLQGELLEARGLQRYLAIIVVGFTIP